MEAMFETMDLDNDGKIDFGEFVAALQVADVVRWLEGKGLSEYRQAFSGICLGHHAVLGECVRDCDMLSV